MKPDTRAYYLDAVTRVLRHLVTHMDAAPDLAALASLAHMSPFHFHRVFRGMVGETPLELLRRLRLERAASVLRTSTQPITSIAFEAGFETHEAFTRAFRVAFGEAPSAFRDNPRGRPVLAALCGIHFDTADLSAVFVPRDTGGQHMDVHLEQLPALRLATVVHVGPFNQIGAAFEQLGGIAGRAGLFAHSGAMMVATYDSDPEGIPVEELRSRAGISIPEGIPLPAGLEEQRIPGGSYACHTHIGGYEVLGDVWSRFMGEALPASGHVLAEGTALEIYRTDMRTTPKEQWRTDLLVPVR
ncbi:MAG: AraC family transcriptional regulator [Gemmatimonadaceae bacterium]|nr:AraC family transcriptional regulator [Gemmatimonadaceae bacterium]